MCEFWPSEIESERMADIVSVTKSNDITILILLRLANGFLNKPLYHPQ